MLKQAQHQELQQAARVATTETQAEALIRKQAQAHAEELRKEKDPNTIPEDALVQGQTYNYTIGGAERPKRNKERTFKRT